MIKTLMTFITLALFTTVASAKEPPIDSTAMFDCAIYSGMASIPEQKVFITAAIFLFDKEHGKSAYKNWGTTGAGLKWFDGRKSAIVAEFNEWPIKDQHANFSEKIQGCDTRYGIIDKKVDLEALGIKLGYIELPPK